MINLFSFEPKFFNNNGDQGNLEVIKRVLSEAGHGHQESSISNSDFVLIGDCSIAVLEHFRAELLNLLPELKSRLEAGSPTLLVGRSYELLAPMLGVELTLGERRSEFLVEKIDGIEAFGYHNSEVIYPRLFVSGNFIGTTLFGPLLAKNPIFIERFAKSWGREVSSAFWSEAKNYAAKVREATSLG